MEQTVAHLSHSAEKKEENRLPQSCHAEHLESSDAIRVHNKKAPRRKGKSK
ncbi:Uncharacterized protein DAT39_013070 [Clarias magur]|uniref:Uncharacterized protein n=1 Tax=Clarias magur TaxID=1594786 RepID=A0A8J4U2C4_CLAMG|nr:Uncharacterized protein DAT39_013070 [Clarias magur]